VVCPLEVADAALEDLLYARVILGTDGSERAARAHPVAAAAAATFGCPLDVVHVPTAEDPKTLDLRGLTLRPADDPADGLVSHAQETVPPGLLCLSSRSRGAVSELVFGSVTARVIRLLQAPLLTVGPAITDVAAPWRRMLVCLDGSTTAASMLPAARRWAKHLDLELHLLHITYPTSVPVGGDLLAPAEDRIVASKLQAATDELRDIGIAANWSIGEHTTAAEGITEHAAYRMVDLIALATHGTTGLARLIAGSVALDTVKRATVPVLILRPGNLR
jgi:nucleotide-binding universal stress UspA family protein